MRALDRVIAGCYGAVPRSAAVTCLLERCDTPELVVGAAPGAATQPPPRESWVTRQCERVRRHWGTTLPFPNPLQAVVLALGVGVVFLLGGASRLSAPTYDVIRHYGGETAWGLGFIGLTVALFVCWRWIHHGLTAAYIAAGSGYALFALAVAQSAWHQPTVSWMAVFVFAWLTWVHAMAARRAASEWRLERWIKAKLPRGRRRE